MLLDELGNPVDPPAMASDDAGNPYVLKAESTPPGIYEVDPFDATVIARVPLPGLPFSAFGGMDFDDSTGLPHLTYESAYTLDPTTSVTLHRWHRDHAERPRGHRALRTAAPAAGPPWLRRAVRR